jgi:hypothetical protein
VSVPVKSSLPVGVSDKLDELKHTVSPAKLLSDTDKRKQLFARLAELDEKQKVLQERKELEILRKQVEEREAVVDELEKSLSGPSLSMPKRGKEGSKKPRVAAGFQVPLPSSTPAGDSGMDLLTIKHLREMTGLRRRTRKEMAKLGVVSSESSTDNSASTTDNESTVSDSDDGGSGLHSSSVKKHNRHSNKHTKSGITSKCSDSVKNRQKYPHSTLRFDFVNRNITFEKIDFNLFVAGELEIISSPKIREKEAKARLDLLKKLMYLNSSYDFSVVKSLYAAILREIELGHSNWGDDFHYVESAVLARHKVKNFRNVDFVQLRPKPSFDLPQENSSTVGGEDYKIWFCNRYQRNKCPQKSSHVIALKGGKTRFAKHICATCWQTDRKELPHPECSTACPHASV